MGREPGECWLIQACLPACRRPRAATPQEEQARMNALRYPGLTSLVAVAMLAWPALAQQAASSTNVKTNFTAVESAQNAANAEPGPRTVPGRSIPVPDTVSPQLQSAIAAPYRVPAWNANPRSASEWKELVNKLANAGAPGRAALREKLGVSIQPAVLGGVKAFI